jgi:hypothetical protein
LVPEEPEKPENEEESPVPDLAAVVVVAAAAELEVAADYSEEA